MRRSRIVPALALLFGLATLLASPKAGAVSPWDSLVGYWQGAGKVSLTNGKTERVKCAVSYKTGDNGRSVKQTLRCASADYTISALAELRVSGGAVTGSWEERTYSATGEISGRQAGNVLSLNIKGASFTAALNVATNNCRQSINIAPQGLEVSRISIDLTKC